MSQTTPLSSSLPPPGSSGGSRFLPGLVVNGRYRIIGLLGKGGMGEVYRADDLKLGQPVALKFLPPGLDQKPEWLERFLGEVRTARQVTHPNVCRVYDIGETDGQHFLSMEYIDGEDLSSLLVRIGRLPEERAIEVGRQICAGLAAAHEQGILHRDLKPANIMIDGRGRVRITDFGLAGLVEAVQADSGAGTPAYMAPELIGGSGSASIQSDLYSVGLVLYELFTGKATFQADTLEDLKRMHETSQPSSPSHHVQGLDPAVERVVLHCLEKDPTDRPNSVLAVSAALPGGDPLAAALAAGETPSPELVAEAGKSNAMKPAAAMGLALAALAVLIGGARWGGSFSEFRYLPLEKRPAVLIDRAQEVLEQLGYTEEVYAQPFDTAWGLFTWSSTVNLIGEADSSETRWEVLRERPDAAAFWYRQSPDYLTPNPVGGPAFVRSYVGITNPFVSNPGNVTVGLDLDGSLRRLEVLPTRFTPRAEEEPDWDVLFQLAGLDPERFTESTPSYQRFMAPDIRRAWIGTRADRPGVEYWVEAGSFQGRAALFNVAPAAGLEILGNPPGNRRVSFETILVQTMVPLLFLAITVTAGVMARRHVHQGRADQRGARRLGVAFFVLFLLSQAMVWPGLFTVLGIGEIWPLLAAALFYGGFIYIWYLAAEPLGRRVWPTMFVSSSRLLSRPRVDVRDPLIGRSVLIGLAAAAVMNLFRPAEFFIKSQTQGFPPRLLPYDWDVLLGQRAVAAELLDTFLTGLLLTFVAIISLVVGKAVLKTRWAGALLALAILVLTQNQLGIVGLLTAGVVLTVLLRWGLVAAAGALTAYNLVDFARTSDWGAWHAQPAITASLLLVLIAAYGFWSATGRHIDKSSMAGSR